MPIIQLIFYVCIMYSLQESANKILYVVKFISHI